MIGFLAGVVMDPVSYSNGQISYRFAPSVPFSDAAKERIAAEVLEEMNTERDPEGGNCTVRFEDHAIFPDLVTALTDLEDPESKTAFFVSDPCRIYFNAWYFPYPLVSSFTDSLIHELGHAWNIEHNPDSRSLFYFEKRPGQRLLMSDRFALWIAQQRSIASNE